MAIKFYCQPLHFEENEEIKTIVIQIKKLKNYFIKYLVESIFKYFREQKYKIIMSEVTSQYIKELLHKNYFEQFENTVLKKEVEELKDNNTFTIKFSIDDKVIPLLILDEPVYNFISTLEKYAYPWMTSLEEFIYNKEKNGSLCLEEKYPVENKEGIVKADKDPQIKEIRDKNSLLFFIAAKYKFAFWNERANHGDDAEKWGNANLDILSIYENKEESLRFLDLLIKRLLPFFIERTNKEGITNIVVKPPFFRFFTEEDITVVNKSIKKA